MADSNRRGATTQMSPSTKAVGFAAAVLMTVFSLIYVAGQLAEWMGWLGSAGGPESTSTPLGIAILLTPSLLLGPAFLLLAVSVHQLARQEHRVWSHAGVSFASGHPRLQLHEYGDSVHMAGVLRGDGLERTARRFLIANGLLLPFLALQMYWHSLIRGGALWAITFPGATWTLAVMFRRGGGDIPTDAAYTLAPVEQRQSAERWIASG